MTLTGHDGAVNAVAYSLDGNMLASASADTTVRIWDMRTGEEMTTPLLSDNGAVNSVAFAPDGESVASGTEHGVVCVWSLMSGTVAPQKLQGHSAAIFCVLYSQSGSHLASSSADKTVRLWSARTNQHLAVLRGHTAAVHTLTFAPDGLTLASGSEDQTIQLWDIATRKLLSQTPYRHDSAIHDICFFPDGQKIAAGCGNDVILCKPQNGRKNGILCTGAKLTLSVSASPDGQSLVSACGNSVCLTTMPRLTARSSSVILDAHTESVRTARFAPNGLYVASASNDCTIRVWNVNGKSELKPLTEHEIHRIDTAAVSTTINSDVGVLKSHTDEVTSVAISRDAALIVSGSLDRSIRVWDPRTGNLKAPPFLGHADAVFSVDISSDGRTIASASGDHTIRLWDAQTGKAIGSPLLGHTKSVRTVVFSPDAQWLASGSDDKSVRIWEAAGQFALVADPLIHDDKVKVVAFSPNNQLVAVGDSSGRIHFWNRETGQTVGNSIQSNDAGLKYLAFSPEGAHILSDGNQTVEFRGPPRANSQNSRDFLMSIETLAVQTIKLRNVITGEVILTLRTCQNGSINSVAYSTDSQFISSGSEDKEVHVWNAVTGAVIATLRGHTGSVRSVAFAPDCRFIVSASSDSTIRVWNLIEPSLQHLEINAFAALDPNDGWVRGPGGELLLWVPAAYRTYLYRLKAKPGEVEITVGNAWHRGTSWTSCWNTDIPEFTSTPM